MRAATLLPLLALSLVAQDPAPKGPRATVQISATWSLTEPSSRCGS
ncbi:MAG TPA: hypothetical protein VJ600_09505 [Holophagaceae bacterium]|nr:hypothetical protein [Holophagaceae bacterium]